MADWIFRMIKFCSTEKNTIPNQETRFRIIWNWLALANLQIKTYPMTKYGHAIGAINAKSRTENRIETANKLLSIHSKFLDVERSLSRLVFLCCKLLLQSPDRPVSDFAYKLQHSGGRP